MAGIHLGFTIKQYKNKEIIAKPPKYLIAKIQYLLHFHCGSSLSVTSHSQPSPYFLLDMFNRFLAKLTI